MTTADRERGFSAVDEHRVPWAETAAGLEFRLLGPLEVRVDDRPVNLGGPRRRAVLAALLLAPDQVVSVDSLAEQVWDGRPPKTARTQVAICVAGLRQSLRDVGVRQEVIATAAPGYLVRTRGHRVDVDQFGAEVERAAELVRQGLLADACRVLGGALALWRGPALDGVPARFAELEAAQLAEQRMHAMEQHLAVRLELGEHRNLIGVLNSLVRAYPMRDRLRAYLMLALHRSGRRAEALDTFRQGWRLSIEEIGLEPGAELREMHEMILNDRDPSVPSPIPAGSSQSGPLVVPAQLPPAAFPFLGRAEEIRALDGLIAEHTRQGQLPVGLIIGMPGIGKTSLALHWGHRVTGQFPDGQLFADLSEQEEDGTPLSPRTVLRRFLGALGAGRDQIPDGLEECAALYRSMLDGRRMLVVLARAARFAQVTPLLPGPGATCVLVTATRPMPELAGSYGALRLRLDPLGPAEAAQLLESCVEDGRVDARSPVARRLARLCDHLPLALRAAGARLVSKPHWTINRLVERMADPRRRIEELSQSEDAVRARFERWCADLPPDLLAAFQALASIGSVEVGIPAASAALGTGRAEAEEQLERLVDEQLIEVDGCDPDGRMRYWFREPTLLYAQERWHGRPPGGLVTR